MDLKELQYENKKYYTFTEASERLGQSSTFSTEILKNLFFRGYLKCNIFIRSMSNFVPLFSITEIDLFPTLLIEENHFFEKSFHFNDGNLFGDYITYDANGVTFPVDVMSGVYELSDIVNINITDAASLLNTIRDKQMVIGIDFSSQQISLFITSDYPHFNLERRLCTYFSDDYCDGYYKSFMHSPSDITQPSTKTELLNRLDINDRGEIAGIPDVCLVIDSNSIETIEKNIKKKIDYHPKSSNLLSIANEASQRFWANADLNDEETQPLKEVVVQWLIDTHNLKETTAKKIAEIIRPEKAKSGRRKEI